MDEKFGPYFRKIKINNFNLILRYLDVFEKTEFSFINKKFKEIISTKYPKSTFMVKSSLKVYKSNIHITFPQDFTNYLRNNSLIITKEIKQIIKNIVNDYYTRLPIIKYFFSKIHFLTVNYLNLKNCEIGKKSMKYLTFYMENKPTLKTLILSDNKLNGQVLEPLVKINESSENFNFEKIKLNRALVDSSTFKILSLIKFSTLIIKNANVDNHHISFFKSEKIQKIDLSNNLISCEGVLYICQNLPNLQELNLSNNNLTDISAVYLSLYIKKQNCKLQNLILKDNKITLIGLMTLLTCLNDSGYQMNKFNISSNAIDSLPKRMTKMSNIKLKSLKIGGHNFTIDDLSYLLDFLKVNPSIEIIDLSKLLLDNVSLHFLFNKFQNNSHLKKLHLNYCYLGNTEINESLTSYYTNEELKNKIDHLSLKHNFYSLKNFNKILNTNSLIHLNLEGNDLNTREDIDSFLDEIVGSTSLKYLNLKNNFLKQKGKSFLMKLSDENCNSSLEIIHLENNQISDLNIELTNILTKNSVIKELYLDHNEIKEELENNYFFHSLICAKMKLLSLKENKIRLSFLTKYINYYKENKGINPVIINIHSKQLLEEYNKENDKNQFLEISHYKNVVAL